MGTGVVVSLIVVGVVLLVASLPLGQPLLGMVSALLLVAVFGELAVHGIEGLSARIGLTWYATSVVVNTIAASHGQRCCQAWHKPRCRLVSLKQPSILSWTYLRDNLEIMERTLELGLIVCEALCATLA